MLTSKSMLSLPGFWCFWHKNSSSDSLETLSSRSTLFLFVFLGLGESSSSSVYHLCLEPSNISWISSNGKDLIFIPRQHFVGQYAYVVGWGRTQHGVAATPSLLQVRLSYVKVAWPWKISKPEFCFKKSRIHHMSTIDRHIDHRCLFPLINIMTSWSPVTISGGEGPSYFCREMSVLVPIRS